MTKGGILLIVASLLAAVGTAAAQRTASLPVVLVAFDAVPTLANEVLISWTTQQQVNTDHFDIEKSNDGISWRRMATVKATGNSAIPITYHASDGFPIKGANYYRICIHDRNGATGYTITKCARVNSACKTMIYPNPTAATITVSLGQMPRAEWRLTLINNLGQVLLQRRFANTTTQVQLPVSQYKDGLYTLEINDGFSKENKPLMINHR
jgi:hypothetical protein